MQSPPKTNIDPWNKCLNPKENNLLTNNTFKPKTRGIFNHITRTKSIAIKLIRHDTNTVTDCIFSLITFQQIQMCSAPSKVSASSLWNGWSQFFCVLNDWGFPICIHSSKVAQNLTSYLFKGYLLLWENKCTQEMRVITIHRLPT